MVWIGLPEVTFELVVRSEGAFHTANLGKSVSGRRTASAKALRWELCLVCLRNSKEACVSGREWGKVRVGYEIIDRTAGGWGGMVEKLRAIGRNLIDHLILSILWVYKSLIQLLTGRHSTKIRSIDSVYWLYIVILECALVLPSETNVSLWPEGWYWVGQESARNVEVAKFCYLKVANERYRRSPVLWQLIKEG